MGALYTICANGIKEISDDLSASLKTYGANCGAIIKDLLMIKVDFPANVISLLLDVQQFA